MDFFVYGSLSGRISSAEILGLAGSATAPSFSSTLDTNTGSYNLGGDFWEVSTGGTRAMHVDPGGSLNVTNGYYINQIATPRFVWFETDGTTGNRWWDMVVSSEQMLLRVADDGNAVAANIMTVDRTGNTIDNVAFPNSPINLGGRVNWTGGTAVSAGEYAIQRDADGTNQLHFNIPTGASYEFSVNDVASAIIYGTSSGRLDLGTIVVTTIFGGSVSGRNDASPLTITGGGVGTARGLTFDAGTHDATSGTQFGTLFSYQFAPTSGNAFFNGVHLDLRNRQGSSGTANGNFSGLVINISESGVPGGSFNTFVQFQYNGTDRFIVLTNGSVRVNGSDNPTNPPYSFVHNPDTGIYGGVFNDTIGFSTGGVGRFVANNTEVNVTVPLMLSTQFTPSLLFEPRASLGFSRFNGTEISFTVNGENSTIFSPTQLLASNGTTVLGFANPGYSFRDRRDYGMSLVPGQGGAAPTLQFNTEGSGRIILSNITSTFNVNVSVSSPSRVTSASTQQGSPSAQVLCLRGDNSIGYCSPQLIVTVNTSGGCSCV